MALNKAYAFNNGHNYTRLPNQAYTEFELDVQQPTHVVHKNSYILLTAVLMILSATAGFAASTSLNQRHFQWHTQAPGIIRSGNLQPRIQLNTVSRVFERSKSFEQAPPSSVDGGSQSEPIWDSLIPKGLGYMSHPDLEGKAIPTVFHQLHCLYTIRRAYYATAQLVNSSEIPTDHTKPERWELGKPRAKHVGHCFDFLQQGLTCSADSTLEPAIDTEHEFLGHGFARQCRDYEALKSFVEKYRIFEYTGFLAQGSELQEAAEG